MVDITHKSSSLRKAIAQAVVKVSELNTIQAILEKKVPKGDVLETARVAGLFAAKRTADMIPDCHPLPIEFTKIDYQINELEIIIIVEIQTIYKTGVEVEAMHAASVVALTLYDMLKPIDRSIEICSIKLLEKLGGKSSYSHSLKESISISIIVVSDDIYNHKKKDLNGQLVLEKLKHLGCQSPRYFLLPDEETEIKTTIQNEVNNHIDLILLVGGTGITPKDKVPEILTSLLTTEIPGISEMLRHYGQLRSPYAMISRNKAGFIHDSLVISLPGSMNGVKESIDALFPNIFHIFRVRKMFTSEE
jgi:GTP cyclohydrolase subunit MoaC